MSIFDALLRPVRDLRGNVEGVVRDVGHAVEDAARQITDGAYSVAAPHEWPGILAALHQGLSIAKSHPEVLWGFAGGVLKDVARDLAKGSAKAAATRLGGALRAKARRKRVRLHGEGNDVKLVDLVAGAPPSSKDR